MIKWIFITIVILSVFTAIPIEYIPTMLVDLHKATTGLLGPYVLKIKEMVIAMFQTA